MSLDGGMLNLTNWAGNVIMPTLAGSVWRRRDLPLWQGATLAASCLGGCRVTHVLRVAARS